MPASQGVMMITGHNKHVQSKILFQGLGLSCQRISDSRLLQARQQRLKEQSVNEPAPGRVRISKQVSRLPHPDHSWTQGSKL